MFGRYSDLPKPKKSKKEQPVKAVKPMTMPSAGALQQLRIEDEIEA